MFIKEKIQIDPTAQGYLNGIPLGDCDAMINFAGGQIIARNPRKHIRLVDGNMNGAPKRFYLKQAFSMQPLQILKAFLKEGKARVVTERELELLRLLEAQGVPVMHPVAWGSRRLLGVPLSGFLLVEEVQGKSFTDMYETLDELGRRRLMTAYGSLVGFMHKKGLDSIVRVTDMICVSKDFTDFKRSLVVIDREWGSLRRKKISFQKRCEQLGKMFAKMLRWIGLPTDREVISFTRGYLNEFQDLNHSISQVLERSTFYALKSIKGKAKYDQIRKRLEGFVRKD